LNLRIVDVAVRYHERRYGETNISRFRHGLLLLRMSVFAARKLRFLCPPAPREPRAPRRAPPDLGGKARPRTVLPALVRRPPRAGRPARTRPRGGSRAGLPLRVRASRPAGRLVAPPPPPADPRGRTGGRARPAPRPPPAR